MPKARGRRRTEQRIKVIPMAREAPPPPEPDDALEERWTPIYMGPDLTTRINVRIGRTTQGEMAEWFIGQELSDWGTSPGHSLRDES